MPKMVHKQILTKDAYFSKHITNWAH